MKSIKIILVLLSCIQGCTRSIFTSELAAPKVDLLSMGPNIPAGQKLKVNYTASVPENKTVTEIQISQKLNADTEFRPVQTIKGNPGSFIWVAPSVPQANVQIRIKAIDNRMREGSSGESPLMNIVRANVLTETTSASQPPTSVNGGTANYGGECTIGYSVRVSIVAVRFGDRVSDTAPSVIPEASQVAQAPCVDHGQGIGTWSYSFVASAVNPTSPYASYSYIFDVYDTLSQQPVQGVSQIGRVWLNTPSVPANPRIAFKSFTEYLSWHYALVYMNSTHGGISFAPLPSNSTKLYDLKTKTQISIRDFISHALGQSSYDAWSEAISPDSWQYHALEQSGLGYYIPYYSFNTNASEVCASNTYVASDGEHTGTTIADCEAFIAMTDLKISFPNDASHAARLGVRFGSSSSKPLAALIDVDQNNADHDLKMLGFSNLANTAFGNVPAFEPTGELNAKIHHEGTLNQFLNKSDLSISVTNGDVVTRLFTCNSDSDCTKLSENEYTGSYVGATNYSLGTGTKAQLVVDLSAVNSDPNKLGTSHLSGSIVNSTADLKIRTGSDATFNNRFPIGQEMISRDQAFAALPIVLAKASSGAKVDFDLTLKEDSMSMNAIFHTDAVSFPSLSVDNKVIASILKLDWNTSSYFELFSNGTDDGTIITNEAISYKLKFDSAANNLLPIKPGNGTIEMNADAGSIMNLFLQENLPGPSTSSFNASGVQVTDVAPLLYTKPAAVKNLGSKPIRFVGTGSYAGGMTSANSGECVSVDRGLIFPIAPASPAMPFKMNATFLWPTSDGSAPIQRRACENTQSPPST